MKFARADVGRARGQRRTAFASRAVDGGCWALAIALLGAYCVLRSYDDHERRAAIALFLQPRGGEVAAEFAIVEPTDLRPLDAAQ